VGHSPGFPELEEKDASIMIIYNGGASPMPGKSVVGSNKGESGQGRSSIPFGGRMTRGIQGPEKLIYYLSDIGVV